jgi:hypothetical protein
MPHEAADLLMLLLRMLPHWNVRRPSSGLPPRYAALAGYSAVALAVPGTTLSHQK